MSRFHLEDSRQQYHRKINIFSDVLICHAKTLYFHSIVMEETLANLSYRIKVLQLLFRLSLALSTCWILIGLDYILLQTPKRAHRLELSLVHQVLINYR